MEENALESLIVLNNDIYRDLQKVKASLSDAENFRIMHIVCLYCIYKKEGEIYATHLSDVAHLDKAAISRALADLEVGNYISKHCEKDTKYKAKLMLTKKGREEAKRIKDSIDKATSAILKDFDEDEIVTLLSLLEKLNMTVSMYLNSTNA